MPGTPYRRIEGAKFKVASSTVRCKKLSIAHAMARGLSREQARHAFVKVVNGRDVELAPKGATDHNPATCLGLGRVVESGLTAHFAITGSCGLENPCSLC